MITVLARWETTSMTFTPNPLRPLAFLRRERALLVGIATAGLFFTFGGSWLGDLSNPGWASFMFAWLFAVMLWSSFAVVRHADGLAVRLGEPFGTLILTLAVISIEVVMISAVMLTGAENPALARDTMFAVLMIVLNGILGITLLLGGLKHHEQEYNLRGASAYLGVIIPLAAMCIVMPRFTTSTPDSSASPLLSVFLIVMSVGLYGIFLTLQSARHSTYFKQPARDDGEDVAVHDEHGGLEVFGVGYHAVMLVLTMLPIVLLSKNMAKVVDHGSAALGAPTAVSGFLVAVLVLSPEAMAAVKAALANQLQRTMNIALGSALATIGLTIPAVLVIGMFTGKTVELGLENVELVLLVVTLAVSMVNFGGGRTNIMQGAVHLLLFVAYIVLIFD
jgi:Ca2+:H+ antiporter